jgi:hypothetical protein
VRNLHPEIEGLLVALDSSPLGWLANVARSRLETEDNALLQKGSGPPDVYQQLAWVDEVIRGVLTRELALVASLQETASRLGVKEVAVAPQEGVEGPGSRYDALFRPERARAIQQFMSVWEESRTAVAQNLESGGIRG